jgi:hypothetical protein
MAIGHDHQIPTGKQYRTRLPKQRQTNLDIRFVPQMKGGIGYDQVDRLNPGVGYPVPPAYRAPVGGNVQP